MDVRTDGRRLAAHNGSDSGTCLLYFATINTTYFVCTFLPIYLNGHVFSSVVPHPHQFRLIKKAYVSRPKCKDWKAQTQITLTNYEREKKDGTIIVYCCIRSVWVVYIYTQPLYIHIWSGYIYLPLYY